MVKLANEEDFVEIEYIILDIIDYFNKNYSNNSKVESEYDLNALLNTISFNSFIKENHKPLKVDAYDFNNSNSYIIFNNNEYDDPINDKYLLDKMNKLHNYVGTGYLSNTMVYPLSYGFDLDNDNAFHPNRVLIGCGQFVIYGTQNRELLKVAISVQHDNKIKIKGGGTELFFPPEDNIEYSDYALSYLEDFFSVVDLKVKDIDYTPVCPKITVVKKGKED